MAVALLAGVSMLTPSIYGGHVYREPQDVVAPTAFRISGQKCGLLPMPVNNWFWAESQKMAKKVRVTQEEEVIRLLRKEGFRKLTREEMAREPYKSLAKTPECFVDERPKARKSRPRSGFGTLDLERGTWNFSKVDGDGRVR